MITREIVITADIVDGNEAEAIDDVRRETLGIARMQDLHRDGDRMVFRWPIPADFFCRLMNNELKDAFQCST